MTTLNAKLTNGSECQTISENDGFELQTDECGSERLKMPNWPMALNAKLKNENDGSELQAVNDGSKHLKLWTTTLNAKLWMMMALNA